jgi:hypothetical protein
MSDLTIQVLANVIGAIVIAAFGIGSVKVIVNGVRARKTGKKMVLFSWVMMLGGIAWADKYSPPQGGFDFNQPGTMFGITIALYGVLLFLIGLVVAWYQKP